MLRSDLNTLLQTNPMCGDNLNVMPSGKLTKTPGALLAASISDAARELTKLSFVKNRSAYEMVRCEIGSMRRMRVTKGICLPSDYPIHVVCGSKDVIHSWAIPGLGIKIDCIPGYNSHRRVMFR